MKNLLCLIILFFAVSYIDVSQINAQITIDITGPTGCTIEPDHPECSEPPSPSKPSKPTEHPDKPMGGADFSPERNSSGSDESTGNKKSQQAEIEKRFQKLKVKAKKEAKKAAKKWVFRQTLKQALLTIGKWSAAAANAISRAATIVFVPDEIGEEDWREFDKELREEYINESVYEIDKIEKEITEIIHLEKFNFISTKLSNNEINRLNYLWQSQELNTLSREINQKYSLLKNKKTTKVISGKISNCSIQKVSKKKYNELPEW